MGAEKAVELVEIGGKIATLCSQLAEVREKRDELSKQVSALEKELTPLLVRHGILIAEMAGAAVPAPPPAAPAASNSTMAAPMSGGGPDRQLERRIIKYLEDADPGVGAMDIARHLNVDAAKVREVMHGLATRNQSGGSMPIEPDAPTH